MAPQAAEERQHRGSVAGGLAAAVALPAGLQDDTDGGADGGQPMEVVDNDLQEQDELAGGIGEEHEDGKEHSGQLAEKQGHPESDVGEASAMDAQMEGIDEGDLAKSMEAADVGDVRQVEADAGSEAEAAPTTTAGAGGSG